MPAQIVLSLQRAGAAAVLSLQFPLAPSIAASLDGAGGLSTRKRARPKPELEQPALATPTPAPMPLPALAVAPVIADDWDDEEAAVLAAVALLMQ